MIAAVLIALTFAQATPAQFDLVCQGERRDAKAGAVPQPVEYRLRIDLDARVWCQDQCSGTGSIKEVTAARITLYDSERHGTTHSSQDSSWIDRTTGRHHQFSSVRMGRAAIGHTVEAQCSPASFSGMPSALF